MAGSFKMRSMNASFQYKIVHSTRKNACDIFKDDMG